MHPMIWGALALLLLSKKGTTSAGASGTSGQLAVLQAQQTALLKAQQASLAAAQKAAAAKPSASAGTGSGSGGGVAQPGHTVYPSNQLSSFLSNLSGGSNNPGAIQTIPVSTDLGTIADVSGGDYSFTPDPLQSLLLQDEAIYGTPNVDPIDSPDSGLTDLISAPSDTDSSITDFQVAPVEWPGSTADDTTAADTSTDGGIDYYSYDDPSSDLSDLVE